MSDQLLQLGRRVSDELLAPAASEVDALGRFPRGHIDRLASTGLYGLAGPAKAGGLGADRETGDRVLEDLARGCLSTTFVWLQHHGVLRSVAAAVADGRDQYASLLAGLCSGQRRAGIAVGGVRPGAAPLRVHATRSGWELDGTVPWVTGWGLIDVLHVAAVDPAGDVVWLLIDVPRADSSPAGRGESIETQQVALMAVRASQTVVLTFRGHAVPADAMTSRTTYAEWQAADRVGLRGNGSLALGLTARCAALHRDGVGGSLPERVGRARADLDAANAARDPQLLAQSRAAATLLAWNAAASLMVDAGSRSTQAGSEADRAVREAAFLLVFGTRPTIREALVASLAQ